jgi:hypothetical protein
MHPTTPSLSLLDRDGVVGCIVAGSGQAFEMNLGWIKIILSSVFKKYIVLNVPHALNFPRVLTPQDLIPPNLLPKRQMPSDKLYFKLKNLHKSFTPLS